MKWIASTLCAGTLAWAGAMASPAVAKDMRVQIVLDMSGSMAAAAKEGGTRADAARIAVLKALESFPEGVPVSLRLYGHRVHKDAKAESCRDSELVVDFSEDATDQILSAFDSATPRGQTPIEFALHEAAEDFGPPAETDDAVILLISDGNETCGGDPVQLVDELLAQGFKMRIYTVGLQVDRKAKAVLEKVSEKTGGTYIDASDTEKLQEAVVEASETALYGARITTAAVTPLADDVKGHPRAIAQCDPGKALRDELAEGAPNIRSPEDGGRSGGLVLDMEITEVHARPVGIFTGPKSITARGTLRRGSKVVASFEGKRSSLGRVLRSGSTCSIVHAAAIALAHDIQEWLENPTMDARLGDLAVE